MKNIRKDEANQLHPDFARVGTVEGKPLVRAYFNHTTEERESMMPNEEGESETHTVFLADFIERVSDKDNALDLVKEEVIEQITAYDTSPTVNSFTLQGKQMWLPKETRVGLMNSITIEKAAGKETTVLWFDSESYTIPVDQAIQMLSALELYALECYNVTAAHTAQVLTLSDVSAVVSYDYTANYPEKLNF